MSRYNSNIKIQFIQQLEMFIADQNENALEEAKKLGQEAFNAQISEEDMLNLYVAYLSQRGAQPDNFGLDNDIRPKNNPVYFLAEFLGPYQIPILKYLK